MTTSNPNLNLEMEEPTTEKPGNIKAIAVQTGKVSISTYVYICNTRFNAEIDISDQQLTR